MKDRALTPDQKKAVTDALIAAWLKHPDMRLGQLLTNALSVGPPAKQPSQFYVEDFELVRWVEKFDGFPRW